MEEVKIQEDTTTMLTTQIIKKQSMIMENSPEYLEKTLKKKYRWLMLFLLNVVMSGNFFCYDNPAYLETHIEKEYNLSADRYGLLYSSYGANLILPLFSGMMYDRFGTRWCMLFFTFLVMLGQAIIMLGGSLMSFRLLLLGRFIFGIGCEN
jgi:MFS family permease